MVKRKREAEPWERQPGETAKAFAAFCAYRDLGPDRSLRKACQRLGKNRITVCQWSSKNGWVERAAAWDEELDREARAEEIKAVRAMRKRHIDLAVGGQGLVVMELQKYVRAAQRSPETPTLTVDQCHRLGDWATKLERTSRGEDQPAPPEEGGVQDPSAAVVVYLPERDPIE